MTRTKTLNPDYVTVAAAATMLSVSTRTVRDWYKDGELIGFRIPQKDDPNKGEIRISTESIRDFVTRRQNVA